MAIIIDKLLYIANVGDSRAILAYGNKGLSKQISIDHKPDNKTERKRIRDNGGRIYRSKSRRSNSQTNIIHLRSVKPLRIFPGRLSVSRAIGDFKAKNNEEGGNSKVLIAVPDIK